MLLPACRVDLDKFHSISAVGIVTRCLQIGQAQQTLILDRCGLFPLRGADSRAGLEAESKLFLSIANGDGRQPYGSSGFGDAAWDAATESLYIIDRSKILRLDQGNSVSVITRSAAQQWAGYNDGGVLSITSNGSGTLFVAVKRSRNSRVYQIRLPVEWASVGFQPATETRHEAAAAAPATATAPAAGRSAPREHELTAIAEPTATLLIDSKGCIVYIVRYDPGPGDDPNRVAASLIYASETAIYRLPLGSGPDAASAAGVPVLLAGREGVEGNSDGRGEEARFTTVAGIAIAGDGCVYVADYHSESVAVRKVARDGTVSTLVSAIALENVAGLGILPNGYLAICGTGIVHVLDLGLVPACAARPPRPPPGPPRRTLPADLGALLDRQPDGTADLEVVVGDRAFPVHRALLAARCDYFRQRLGGGFADGGAARLSLPDADPEAFALTLRFLYTGGVDIPAAHVAAVAELADRLLLPDLCADAQARVLAGVAPESVVGAMLWAESRGASFLQLLADLKAWYVEHYAEVRREAGPSILRLADSPHLMMSLMDALEERRAKAARVG